MEKVSKKRRPALTLVRAGKKRTDEDVKPKMRKKGAILLSKEGVCANPNPPLQEGIVDFVGDGIPVQAWNVGFIWGGHNMPFDHIKEIRTFGRWYTRRHIEHLLIPFLKRGVSSSSSKPTNGESVLSLRNIDRFMYNIDRELRLAFWVLLKGETSPTFLILNQKYKDFMSRWNREGFDTVRRQVRCYVTGADGVVYPTTMSQLRCIKLLWESGIIYTAIAFMPYIQKWNSMARHRRRKIKKDRGKNRKRVSNSLPPRFGAKIYIHGTEEEAKESKPVFFEDKEQFEIVTTGAPPEVQEKAMAIIHKSNTFNPETKHIKWSYTKDTTLEFSDLDTDSEDEGW